jgi:hypothetical protein
MIQISKDSKNSWRVTTALGLILSVAGLAMMPVFPEVAYRDVDGYGGPIFAFEMATSLSDLIDVFGPPENPERADRIAQMNTGNLWDFGFLVIYSLFVAMFFYASKVTSKSINKMQNLCLLGISLGLTSGLMDAFENHILLGITSNIEAHVNLHLLKFLVWAKFFSIMICIALAGNIMRSHRSRYWRVIGSMSMMSSLTIIIAFLSPERFGWLIQHGVTFGWVMMLAYAWQNSARL